MGPSCISSVYGILFLFWIEFAMAFHVSNMLLPNIPNNFNIQTNLKKLNTCHLREIISKRQSHRNDQSDHENHKLPMFPTGQFSPSIDQLAKQYQYQQKIKEYSTVNTSDTEKRVFNDVLQFPCEFAIKVIGLNDGTFANDIVSTVASILLFPPESIKFSRKETTGGKYLSLTLYPSFDCADDLYSVYAALSEYKRVKFVI